MNRHLQCILCSLFLAATLLPAFAVKDSQWSEYTKLASAACNKGQYALAEKFYIKAVKKAEGFGPLDLDLATSLRSLACVYQEQHKYEQSVPLYRRALVIWSRVLGPQNEYGPIVLNSLAQCYSKQGKHTEEQAYRRALANHKQWIEYTDVGTAAYRKGQYSEAEKLFSEALKIAEGFGPLNTRVAVSLSNLGHVYYNLGEYAEAELLLKRAVAVDEKAFSPDFRNSTEDELFLALTYTQEGKSLLAEPLCRHVLAIREKALGPDHPDVATTLRCLAIACRKQGKYAQAESRYKRVLTIEEKASGPDHPDVAITLSALADVYYKQSKYREAQPLFERALLIRQKALRPEDPGIAKNLISLANVYYCEGKYEDAEQLYKRTVAIKEKTLGPNSPEVAKWKRAARVCSNAVRKGNSSRTQTLGIIQAQTASSPSRAATLSASESRPEKDDCEKRYEEATSKVWGSNPDTLGAVNILKRLAQYGCTEAMALLAGVGCTGSWAPEVPKDQAAAQDLANMALAFGLADRAAEGRPHDQYWLGVFYKRGLGVAKDMDKAWELALEAAKGGCSVAQFYVGTCYYDPSDGTGKNTGKATYWYEQAAVQGFVRARQYLDLMRQGVEQLKKAGSAAYMSGQYQRAVECYSKAISQAPYNAESYQGRAFSYMLLKQYQRAVEDFSKAISLDSYSSKAYYGRGVTYNALNDSKHANEDFAKAISLDPSYAAKIHNLR